MSLTPSRAGSEGLARDGGGHVLLSSDFGIDHGTNVADVFVAYLPPRGCPRAGSGLGVFERGGHGSEVGRRERRFDEPQELALLRPDVVREVLAELVQSGRVGRLVDGERVGACPSDGIDHRKVSICRAFEAADGTRTHDLLHGKQTL